jgi:hypothetical protein
MDNCYIIIFISASVRDYFGGGFGGGLRLQGLILSFNL